MTAFPDEVVRARFDWGHSHTLDAMAAERGLTRGEAVAGIVVGAIEADVADDLLDLGRQTPQPTSQGDAT